jgi:hypothetical protein
MPKYLVNMILYNKSKTITVSANNCKDAEGIAKGRFPSAEIGRVSSKPAELDYFQQAKKEKK